MAEPTTPPAPILLAWVTEGRRALVVGGGWISTRRVRALLEGKADVHVVSPTLTPELAERVESGEITAEVRRWRPSDFEGADLVLVAIDEHGVSREISRASRALRIPVHVADDPPLCDFYFAATAREGPVQIAISTGGAGPALAGRLRDRIRGVLPEGLGVAVERFGRLRHAVRRAMPRDDQGPARMKWLGDYGRGAPWEELAALDDARIAELADEAAEG
jgi:precorrin-2 dehydrogenase / sirohydrochlorin ferrochelatase